MKPPAFLLTAGVLLAAMSVPSPIASAHLCVDVSSAACNPTTCHDGTYHHHNVIDPNAAEVHSSCYSEAQNCPPQFTHTYGFGGSINLDSATADSRTRALGSVIVHDSSMTPDCNGDGIPGGGDGDWDTGIGGGFFPIDHHGLGVCVNDVVWGPTIVFVTGVDGDGDGLITPDVNPADAIAGPFVGCGTAPGDACAHWPMSTDPNLEVGAVDAPRLPEEDEPSASTHCDLGSIRSAEGYWVFLQGTHIVEDGSISVSSPPTMGTITTF